MARPTLVAIVAVVIVAGVAVAVGAAIYFGSSGQGKYAGPGLPYTKYVTCQLSTTGSWCDQEIVANVTPFWINASETISMGGNATCGGGATCGIGGLMNQTDFSELQANTSIAWLPGTESALPSTGFGPYHGFSNGTYYFVMISDVSASFSITEELTVEAG